MALKIDQILAELRRLDVALVDEAKKGTPFRPQKGPKYKERERLSRAGRGRGYREGKPSPLGAAQAGYVRIRPQGSQERRSPRQVGKQRERLVRVRENERRGTAASRWKELSGRYSADAKRAETAPERAHRGRVRGFAKRNKALLTALDRRGDDERSLEQLERHVKSMNKHVSRSQGSVAKPSGGPRIVGAKSIAATRGGRKVARTQRKDQPGHGHGGGAAGKAGGARKGYGSAYGPPHELHQESQMYVAKTLGVSDLFEAILLERRSKKARKLRSATQAEKRAAYQGSPERASQERKQKRAGRAERKVAATSRAGKAAARGETELAGKLAKATTHGKRFKVMRAAGKIKGHKEGPSDKKEGKKKYENPTSFKKCSPGAMVSTPYLRQEIPLNKFQNPSDKNPTWPIRSNCRASLAGVGRALQFAKPSAEMKRRVLQKVNALGGVRGKARIRLWGTGVGGSRMKTHRGGSGKAKRHKAYGTPTGERDDRVHEPDREAGHREVPRARGHAAKQPLRAETKRKKARQVAGRKVTIARGQKRLGRELGSTKISPNPKLATGRAEAAKFAKKRK